MTPTMIRTRSLVVLAAAVVTAAGCSSKPPDTAAGPEAAPLAVRVATIVEAPVADGAEAGGVVQARTTAVVAARVMAPVRAVRVSPGDRVRAGQVLVELDGRDLQAGAASASAGAEQARSGAAAAAAEERAAQAALVLARATHGRFAALFAKKSATPQEMDEATAALAAAEARAASATARVQEATSGIARATAASDAAGATASFLLVTAPFDGVVTEKLVEPGNMAAPGMPLLRLEDTRGFRLDVRIDDSRASHLTPGASIDVQLDGADGQTVAIAGTVAEVSRAVDSGARSVLVKVTLPASPDLRSGAFGRVRLPGAARSALVVPADALVTTGQVTSVFVVDGGVARLRLVRVRGSEVLAGLTAGETVVVAPPPGLTDGRRVTSGGGR
jgi:RND family efflux transporter MFP subunit